MGQKASKWWVLNRSIIFYKTLNSRNFSYTAIFILSTTSTQILFSCIIIDLYCNELSTNYVTTLTSLPPWKKKIFWTAIAIYILKLFQNYKFSSHMMKFLNWVKTSHKYKVIFNWHLWKFYKTEEKQAIAKSTYCTKLRRLRMVGIRFLPDTLSLSWARRHSHDLKNTFYLRISLIGNLSLNLVLPRQWTSKYNT